MTENSIAIVGAGIAGLAAAIALSPKGPSIHLLEQAPVFTEVGAGLQLGPNAVRALQAIGCWESVRPITSAPPEIHIYNGKTGRCLRRMVLGAPFSKRHGAPYLVAHRADLQAALLGHAGSIANVEIAKNCKVTAAAESRDGVHLEIDGRTSQKHKFLIAADGIKSGIRLGLFPSSSPIALQLIAYRTLLQSVPTISGVAMDCVNLWLTPWGHVVHYPVGNAGKLNLVAVTRSGHVSSTFASSHPKLQGILATAASWRDWPVAHVPTLPRWHSGNICLVGDAAHGTVPFLAQGAAMALEDAAVLKSVIGTPAPFENYEELRKSRVERLDTHSRSMVKLYHAGFPLSSARDTLLRLGPSRVLDHRLDWIYSGVTLATAGG